MSPRKYAGEKRRAAADQTRQRIVDAIVALHAERGIAATTAQHVAARADVAVGTVLRYFAGVDLMVQACGLHLQQTLDPPDARIFANVSGASNRLRVAIDSLFAYYERGERWFRPARFDMERIPALARGIEYQRTHQEELIDAAIGTAPERVRKTAIGLTRFETWNALLESGLRAHDIPTTVYHLLLPLLEDHS